jgi:hypothetical protein
MAETSMAGTPQTMTPATLESAKADIKQYSIDHEPIRWAQGHVFLSHQCLVEVDRSSGPTRAADKGIEHVAETLKVFTEKNHAPNFAAAQMVLARLYPKRAAGNRTENLTKALACAKTALRICKDPACPPATVAALHEIIGSIYEDDDFVSSNSRAANQDLAIRHYLASLQRCSMYDDDVRWAHRQVKVGRIYHKRTNGKRGSNLKVAIKHFLEALKVSTKSEHRESWAKIHEHLAMSYEQLMCNEEFTEGISALVEQRIASCKNALQVCSPTYDATAW